MFQLETTRTCTPLIYTHTYPSSPTPFTLKGKTGHQTRDIKFPKVPPCPCGAHRKFEFQVMPSILHVLDVDKFANDNDNPSGTRTKESKSRMELDQILSKNNGGMNWGTIAVYSCVNSCEINVDEFVVVQESADGNPQKRELKKVEPGEDVD
jgi:hypothetical protein